MLDQTNPAKITSDILENPVGFPLLVGLAAVLVIFTDAPTWPRRIVIGLIHWLLEYALLMLVIWGVAHAVGELPQTSFKINLYLVRLSVTLDTLIFAVGVGVICGYLASQLFALYLFVMFALFKRHATHAFSSQRIEDYRSCLRLHIDREGVLTVFPIGVRRVPRRWRVVPLDHGAQTFEPVDRPLEAHLIESPVRITPGR